MEHPSLGDLVRNPLAWLLAGALSVGLFVLFPQLPASLEIAALAALMVLLGAVADQEGRHSSQSEKKEEAQDLRASRLATCPRDGPERAFCACRQRVAEGRADRPPAEG